MISRHGNVGNGSLRGCKHDASQDLTFDCLLRGESGEVQRVARPNLDSLDAGERSNDRLQDDLQAQSGILAAVADQFLRI